MGSAPASNSKLFEPLQIGPYKLSSRLVMAPLTRFRADDKHVQLPFVKDYYTQRACVPGTLLITEATFISPRASGYPNVPGIYNQEQIDAWKEIVESVHQAGGIIFLQLWALGRTANKELMAKEGNGDVVSSSAVPENSDKAEPRALEDGEVWEFVQDYATAAKNAVEGAGFDGVEIHGANGYLVDQFTQNVCNQRTDQWGGSIENRSRFGLEVAKAVVNAVGADKTGIRLSPWSTFQGMKMQDPVPQFTHLLKGLKDLHIAYVHLVESRIAGNADVEATEKNDPFFEVLGDEIPILLAGGFQPDSAKKDVDENYKDKEMAIVFGRHFISNPDLVFRVKKGIEFTKYNRETFYKTGSKEGYIDYPFSQEWEKEQSRL
ncbi:hypothetical protein LTR37_009529 [Vermiconidia calcicola]|uniref:Uncharacterized protein n=1 Tax=Vermiconidia calcicola TaxID=1690605 RepID=A0ACC3N7B1_9PEZI|nr:hypothetical protein LTR37_009529 [Vermiconidia calcicola]